MPCSPVLRLMPAHKASWQLRTCTLFWCASTSVMSDYQIGAFEHYIWMRGFACRLKTAFADLRAHTLTFTPEIVCLLLHVDRISDLDRQLVLVAGNEPSQRLQSWALAVFLNVFNNKNDLFAFFMKLIWLGVGFLNRTVAEICYRE